MVGVEGSALTAHQAGATVEHQCRRCYIGSAPLVAHINGLEVVAVIECAEHVGHIAGVEVAQVEGLEA